MDLKDQTRSSSHADSGSYPTLTLHQNNDPSAKSFKANLPRSTDSSSHNSHIHSITVDTNCLNSRRQFKGMFSDLWNERMDLIGCDVFDLISTQEKSS